MKRLINYVPYFIIIVLLGSIVLCHVLKFETAVSDNADNAPLVIIDPGHGNPDGGAVAVDGTEEQYINLDIALKLREALEKKGYRTLMTRQDNNSIHDDDAGTIREKKVSDIHNRLKIIEENPDSIFVSIHQNHYSGDRYWGTQVFYSANNPGSSVLAQYIQSSVVDKLQPENTRKIKQSGDSIYLLYHAQIPAVMVECGFLSNAGETAKLNDNAYRQQMADAISDGIANYIISVQKTECSSELMGNEDVKSGKK